jgi:uncharacterized protein DUF6134
VAGGILALCLTAFGTAGAETPPPAKDPFRIYGNEISFDIERDGAVIGQHIVTFTRTKQGVRADSRADVNVQLLFLSAYKYRYRASEVWQGGKLQSIESSTNENGEYTHVQAVRDAAGMEISLPEGKYEVPEITPISHWNAALLKGGTLLNTFTGEIDKVQVFDQGSDIVATRNGSLRAHHYLYSGDLNGEIWYDDEGRWVKLRFRAKDGSIIDYICRRCRAAPTITEAD